MLVFGCDTYQVYFSDMLFKYDSPNDVVVQHNKFVEGRYIFSINELRIFMYMLLKVDKHDTEFKEIKIPCHILHSEEKRVNYTQISKACKSLVKKVIEIESTTIKGKRKYSGIPLMARLDYEEGGYIIAKFNDEAKAYLLGLTQNFTKTHFKMFMSIKTFYAYRMYWLLKQYQFIGRRHFDIDEFRDLLDLKEKYSIYRDLKKRVIIPAQKELRGTDICFDFKEKRVAKKVVALDFFIYQNPHFSSKQLSQKDTKNTSILENGQQMIDFTVQDQSTIDKNIRTLILMGFKKAEAEQIINLIQDKEKLKKCLYKFETDCNSIDELKNPKIRQAFLDIFEIYPVQDN